MRTVEVKKTVLMHFNALVVCYIMNTLQLGRCIRYSGIAQYCRAFFSAEVYKGIYISLYYATKHTCFLISKLLTYLRTHNNSPANLQ